MNPWTSLSALGDSVVLLPAAAVIAGWLAALRRHRLALLWCLLLGAALTLVLATKLAFAGWGIGIRAIDFTGLSGHAMRAGAVLPVLAWLGAQRMEGAARVVLIWCGWLAAAAISWSRVMVKAHSPSEALLGALLGMAVAAAFIAAARRHPPRAPAWLLALGILVLLPTSAAPPAPTEAWVERLALALSGHERVYRRGDYLP